MLAINNFSSRFFQQEFLKQQDHSIDYQYALWNYVYIYLIFYDIFEYIILTIAKEKMVR